MLADGVLADGVLADEVLVDELLADDGLADAGDCDPDDVVCVCVLGVPVGSLGVCWFTLVLADPEPATVGDGDEDGVTDGDGSWLADGVADSDGELDGVADGVPPVGGTSPDGSVTGWPGAADGADDVT